MEAMTRDVFEQRCKDMLIGAFGGYPIDFEVDDPEDYEKFLQYQTSIQDLGRWMLAVHREVFDEGDYYLFRLENVHRIWDACWPTAIERLWSMVPEEFRVEQASESEPIPSHITEELDAKLEGAGFQPAGR